MPEWTQLRNTNMRRVLASFENNPYFTVPMPPANYVHAAYKAYVQVNTAQLPEGWSRDRIMAEINALGVPCFSGSCSEVYLEKPSMERRGVLSNDWLMPKAWEKAV